MTNQRGFCVKSTKLIHNGKKHNKFWTAVIGEDNTVTCHWGRLGTKGQSKSFPQTSQIAAQCFVSKKAHDKRRKGYIEVDENKLSLEQLRAELVGANCKVRALAFVREIPDPHYGPTVKVFQFMDVAEVANPDYVPLVYCGLEFTANRGTYHLLIDLDTVRTGTNADKWATYHSVGYVALEVGGEITKSSPEFLRKIGDKAPGIVASLIQ
jgi:predicted DNA-binding WGR domain protein